MRIFAIGDTHLRASARRNDLRLKALDQILGAIVDERPDAVVWPGDFFDRTSTPDDRNTLCDYLQRIANVCPVVGCRGNHDGRGELQIFTEVRARYPISISTRPDVLFVDTAAGSLVVATLPYPEESALAAMGVAPPDVPDVAAAALDVIFMRFADELGQAAARGEATLFIAHANVVGSVASTGQPLCGQEISLRPEHLARIPAGTPKLLAHIHEPQEIHGAIYIGSIAPMDWAEVTPRRFLVLDRDGTRWTQTSHPLQLPKLWHVEGTFDGHAVAWVVRRGPEGPVDITPASFKGDEVRARIRFNASDAGRMDFARAQLLAEFAEAAHLEIEPVAVPDRAVRAPEVAAATTTADKLRAYCALSGLEVADGVLAKLQALETQDAAALLAQLETRLQALVARDREVAA